jgi:hypothetical protein
MAKTTDTDSKRQPAKRERVVCPGCLKLHARRKDGRVQRHGGDGKSGPRRECPWSGRPADPKDDIAIRRQSAFFDERRTAGKRARQDERSRLVRQVENFVDALARSQDLLCACEADMRKRGEL